jgi:hypothetical protein
MPYHLATPQLARFLHVLNGLRNTMAEPAKTPRETLERDGKRGYNPAHRDWPQPPQYGAASMSRVAF